MKSTSRQPITDVMSVSRREWAQICALAAFLWFVIGAIALGLITLAVAVTP